MLSRLIVKYSSQPSNNAATASVWSCCNHPAIGRNFSSALLGFHFPGRPHQGDGLNLLRPGQPPPDIAHVVVAAPLHRRISAKDPIQNQGRTAASTSNYRWDTVRQYPVRPPRNAGPWKV
jgi:hypothetical protein